MAKLYKETLALTRPGFLGGAEWTLTDLTPITILFGKNGSAKSLILRAWRDHDPEGHHYVAPERTGELDYQPNYLAEEMAGATRRNSSVRNHVDQYRRRVVARIQAYFAARGGSRAGDLPGDPGELEQFLATLLPDFVVQLRGTQMPPYSITRTADGSSVGGSDVLSSGEIQLITMGFDILTMAAIWDIKNAPSRVMLIDEPDAHIHPDLQVRFADFLVAVAERFKLQLAVATHSTTLLAALGQFGRADASVIYAERNKVELIAKPFSKHLRELSACLGGHALMGPLFGVPLLLVEGDDDYRIWSQVPRHHVTNFAVVPCGGDEIKIYQKHLEQLFAALREDANGLAGYALLDGDKGKPVPSDANPQEHVRFLKLACRESENLYLADEVLALLDLDWPQAVTRIAAAALNFGSKKEKLQNVANWSRETEDIKDVIAQLTQILDSKNVHWTIRVARAIGIDKPAGHLKVLLGDEVVDALWP